MRIGEVAKKAGMSVGTVRYYEKRGLLGRAPRSESGYRIYTPEAVLGLLLVRSAKALGFTLAEIRELVQVADDHAGGRRARVRSRAQTKLADVDRRIRELRQIRKRLEALSRCDCTGQCPVLRAAITEPVRRIQ